MLTLYGYYHCPCVYESTSALVSLHQTKAGAWKAMRAALWQAAEDNVDARRLYGRPKGAKAMPFQSWAVLPVEVKP